MRVTVVTPSYNQAQFLEETIRSVLLQGYPNLEYIIIDGGSTDGSVEIIRKYEKHLSDWVSEPDRGQSHAINKGFARATGEYIAWLNSDDVYEPGIIANAVAWFAEHPECDMIYSDCALVDEAGEPMGSHYIQDYSWEILLEGDCIPQQTVFLLYWFSGKWSFSNS
jgi:glycosyltransferase involved in cell wall biosynthesis